MKQQNEQKRSVLLMPFCVLACGCAMLGVFRLLGKLDRSVLYGAALGCGVCIVNLVLLHVVMKRAASAETPEAAQQIIKSGVPARMLLICAAFYVGFTFPAFHPVAVVVPFVFPRLSAMLLSGMVPSFRFLCEKAADVSQPLDNPN